jgi:RING-box protein 1
MSQTSITNINEYTVFYTKKYDFKNDDCTICRQPLSCDSIYAKEKGTFSTLSTGHCGHTFHEECITPWLKIKKNCPICAQKF